MNTNSEYQLLKYALNVRHWYQRCWMGVCVCVCVCVCAWGGCRGATRPIPTAAGLMLYGLGGHSDSSGFVEEPLPEQTE